MLFLATLEAFTFKSISATSNNNLPALFLGVKVLSNLLYNFFCVLKSGSYWNLSINKTEIVGNTQQVRLYLWREEQNKHFRWMTLSQNWEVDKGCILSC